MILRQPEESYQSLEMKYESFSSFRIQRDKKSNNPKHTTHSILLRIFFLKKKSIICKFAIKCSCWSQRNKYPVDRKGGIQKPSRISKVCFRASVAARSHQDGLMHTCRYLSSLFEICFTAFYQMKCKCQSRVFFLCYEPDHPEGQMAHSGVKTSLTEVTFCSAIKELPCWESLSVAKIKTVFLGAPLIPWRKLKS